MVPLLRFLAQNVFGSLKKKITCGADRHQWQPRRDLWPPWTHFSWSDRSLWASDLGLCPAICHPFLKLQFLTFFSVIRIQFTFNSSLYPDPHPRLRIQAPDPHSCWSGMICSRVSDPWHFGVDPDPRIRIRGSMPLINGSGSGSGSYSFRHWSSRRRQKTNLKKKVFLFITFSMHIYIIFQR